MTHLKEGDQAPNFTGLNQDSNSISLVDFKKKKLILYFYPKDNTPGCTAESCNLTQNYTELIKQGFDVLGISPDSAKSHINFINKFNLAFDLIADEDKSICLQYGVYGKKKFMGKEYDGVHRTTFIINENQIIEKVFTKVNTKNHAEQILESYKNNSYE
ncbi:MAG: thioredoxin-dependent thiol peroxidase [Flavobacteriales bacterium TMED191]|nr:MAG: thioredoxin-dependent thiol peroxidase [Flavobacteriales bacterium TMED191]|tara:strand:- start:3282 stop:3758 length:477 start_codon:yes stop_codon:yes gene_type:complete